MAEEERLGQEYEEWSRGLTEASEAEAEARYEEILDDLFNRWESEFPDCSASELEEMAEQQWIKELGLQ